MFEFISLGKVNEEITSIQEDIKGSYPELDNYSNYKSLF